MLKRTAAGIASCLAVAAVATAFSDAEAVKTIGTVGPVAAGLFASVGGVVVNFTHELCKNFHERALAYRETIWGLDENEHVGRGVRRAQIAATREVLRLWRAELPRYDACNDDRSHAFAKLLAEWCDEQDDEKTIMRWATAIRKEDVRDKAALRKSFEAAFGVQVATGNSIAERAKEARVLALEAAFTDAVEGALARVHQEDWAKSIRKSKGLQSFKYLFLRESSGGGWFNAFLLAIGKEFNTSAEFKRQWDSVQLGGISAMLLDDIKLSAERHSEIKQLVRQWSGDLRSDFAAIKLAVDDISLRWSEEREQSQRIYREILRTLTAPQSPGVRLWSNVTLSLEASAASEPAHLKVLLAHEILLKLNGEIILHPNFVLRSEKKCRDGRFVKKLLSEYAEQDRATAAGQLMAHLVIGGLKKQVPWDLDDLHAFVIEGGNEVRKFYFDVARQIGVMRVEDGWYRIDADAFDSYVQAIVVEAWHDEVSKINILKRSHAVWRRIIDAAIVIHDGTLSKYSATVSLLMGETSYENGSLDNLERLLIEALSD